MRRSREQLRVERDGRHQPDTPAHLADERMRVELVEPRMEPGLELARTMDEPVAREQVEVRERRGAAGCVAAVGRAVREPPALAVPERLGDDGAAITPPSGR